MNVQKVKSTVNLLEVRNLTVAFDTEMGMARAVDDVSFEVPRGQCVGIVGESGCGKSVTAMSLVRLLPQPAGRILRGKVTFDGEDVLKMPADKLRKLRGGQVGVIFQEPLRSLNPVQRIGEQIAETLMLHRGLTHEAALKEAVEILKFVHIPDAEARVNEYPMSLSGGMRQRVVIAIALACRPQLIIADEPTTALDVTVQQQILALIRELREELGASSILITHDLGVIAQNCDRVVVMYGGRVVERAPVHELFANPRHAYTKALLASMPRPEYPRKSPLPTIPGSVASLHEFVPGCRFCQRMGREGDTLIDRPPLVEVTPGHFVEACPLCTDVARTDKNNEPQPVQSTEPATEPAPPAKA